MSEKQKKQLSEQAAKLADVIEAATKIEGGVAQTSKELYVENYPEGLNAKDDKRYSDYRSDFIAGSAYALGKLAVEAMNKDKSLDRVDGDFHMVGHDHVTHAVHRRTEREDNLNKGKTIVKFGAIKTTISNRAASRTSQLSTAYAMVQEIAAAQLNK